MKHKTYFTGFLKGDRKGTVIFQMKRSKDELSPDLWKYFGEYEVTKRFMKIIKSQLLQELNKLHDTHFTCLIIE